MKKILLILVILLNVIALSACNSNSNEKEVVQQESNCEDAVLRFYYAWDIYNQEYNQDVAFDYDQFWQAYQDALSHGKIAIFEYYHYTNDGNIEKCNCNEDTTNWFKDSKVIDVIDKESSVPCDKAVWVGKYEGSNNWSDVKFVPGCAFNMNNIFESYSNTFKKGKYYHITYDKKMEECDCLEDTSDWCEPED